MLVCKGCGHRGGCSNETSSIINLPNVVSPELCYIEGSESTSCLMSEWLILPLKNKEKNLKVTLAQILQFKQMILNWGFLD